MQKTGGLTKTLRTRREGLHEKHQALLLALEQVSKVLTVEVELSKILEGMATIVAKALGAKWVNFWELTPDKKSVWVVASYGMKPEYMEHSQRHPVLLGKAWIGRAVKTGRPWGTSDILADPKLVRELGPTWGFAVQEQDFRALLCVPTISRRGILGGMCTYYPEIHEFTDFEMRLLAVAANQAATAITNAQIFDELVAEQNKTLAVLNSLSDGLLMFDLEGKIILFNPRAEEMLWLKRTDLLGRRPEELDAQANPLFENIKKISALFISDFESREIEIEQPKRMVLQIINLPVRDPEDKKIGSMRVIHDITAEKETEAIKSNFITVASHQLRTPLSGIKWSLYTLLNKELGGLTSQQEGLLQKTYQENERLISLVNDLLDVSRIEERRLGYKFKKTDVFSLIQEVVEGLKLTLENKPKVRLKIESPSQKLPLISADSVKLKIALFNIIDNAIKYTLKGVVVVSFSVAKSSMIVRIQDTGIGIPKPEQKFVFTKFFRASNAVRVQTEGSGLGLWIANEIMKRHNGKIFFESEESKGTAFFLQFPLVPELMPKGETKGF